MIGLDMETVLLQWATGGAISASIAMTYMPVWRKRRKHVVAFGAWGVFVKVAN